MSEAVKLIVDGFVSLKDRVALEEMRQHRQKLRNEIRQQTSPVFNGIQKTVDDDLKIIEDGFDRL